MMATFSKPNCQWPRSVSTPAARKVLKSPERHGFFDERMSRSTSAATPSLTFLSEPGRLVLHRLWWCRTGRNHERILSVQVPWSCLYVVAHHPCPSGSLCSSYASPAKESSPPPEFQQLLAKHAITVTVPVQNMQWNLTVTQTTECTPSVSICYHHAGRNNVPQKILPDRALHLFIPTGCIASSMPA